MTIGAAESPPGVHDAAVQRDALPETGQAAARAVPAARADVLPAWRGELASRVQISYVVADRAERG